MAKPPTTEVSFHAWLDRLAESRPRRGEAGLSHARIFFDSLDNPQNCAPAVHIVGTAGKGTIAHLLTMRLVEHSLSVGTHMSPHVDDVRERFLLNGQLPSWDSVLDAAREVYSAVEHVEGTTGRPPSFFAATAAMSWVISRRAQADFLVVEAGIGGRYDATNVLDRPDRFVVVTRIGIDHTDVLGTTAVEIAAEKAAVIAGCAGVVLAPQTEAGVAAIVVDQADAAGVEVMAIEPEPDSDWRAESDATAAAVEQLITGFAPPVLRPFRLPPGRMDVVDVGGRIFVLDGAHNATKIDGLAASLLRDYPGGVKCVVAAMGRHKNLESCASTLANIAPLVVATSFGSELGASASNPQAWSCEQLAGAVRNQPDPPRVAEAVDVGEAIRQAWANTTDGDVVLVTGSFLYLADARRVIRRIAAQIK